MDSQGTEGAAPSAAATERPPAVAAARVVASPARAGPRQRQRKRPRSLHHSNEGLVVAAEIVPLQLPGRQGVPAVPTESDPLDGGSDPTAPRRWARVVHPYPWAFVTHAKERWLGRPLWDVYATDFGAYPAAYYDTAIRQGRIRVNDGRVDPDYVVRHRDVLSHCVHRHEPAVAVASGGAAVRIVTETDGLLVVDKQPSLPIHPSGGYHQNTLIHILDSMRGTKHYIIHRLDRLTSGLVLLGKTSEGARDLIALLQQRERCEKLYLARVKGRLAANVPSCLARVRSEPPVAGEWPDRSGRDRDACGYWLSTLSGAIKPDLSLDDFSRAECSLGTWLDRLQSCRDMADGRRNTVDTKLRWLHLACPTRVEQHKDGVCACGRFSDLDDQTYGRSVKPAETSFALVKYDPVTDSSLILCRPKTGRTHQIRVHLQFLGNPIANDPNYGGDMWWNDEHGEKLCQEAQLILESLDCDRPLNLPSSTLTPATQEEVAELDKQSQCQDELLDDFIRRTCVWCARGKGSTVDRAILEFLTRCPYIFLHALQYTIRDDADKYMSFRTELPTWAQKS